KADVIAESFDAARFLPAPGQGAIGLETRADDARALEVLRAIDDAGTNAATRAERLLHKMLGGGCHAPIGALGETSPGGTPPRAVVGKLDGTRLLRAEGEGADAVSVARVVFEKLDALGAVALLASDKPS